MLKKNKKYAKKSSEKKRSVEELSQQAAPKQINFDQRNTSLKEESKQIDFAQNQKSSVENISKNKRDKEDVVQEKDPLQKKQKYKIKDKKAAFVKLIKLTSVHKVKIALAIVMAIFGAAFSIIAPRLIGSITTEIYNSVVQGVGIDFEVISQTLLILIVLYVVSALLKYGEGLLMVYVSYRISKKLRSDVAGKIHRLPLSYFDRVPQGEILSRVTNDISTISQTLSQSLSEIIISTTMIIGILIMMFSINIYMTLAALVIIPISMAMTRSIIKKTQKHYRARQAELGKLNAHVEEMITSHQVVKAFNGEPRTIEVFEEGNDSLYTAAWKSQFLSGLLMPAMRVVIDLGYVLITILGAMLATRGVITVGDIQAFLQYLKNFNMPIVNLANVTNVFQSTLAASERVFEFLEEAEEVDSPMNPVSPDVIKGHICFDNVSFGYDADDMVIHDFSADFEIGTKVAIVGPTGAGKTTLVKLLMHYYDVNQGDIFIDGHSVKDFDRADLRSQFAMVLQDTWLFSGSILENIRYGRLSASDAEVIEAAEKAHVGTFVKMLEKGYHTEINEETTNISAGQKQLITIARAILADPKILIFDEATSSVDTRTELQIQGAMDHLMHGRTSFVIAHRLSTIKNADTILVLDNGNIVEQGGHEELLEKGGFYAKLYRSQFEG